MPKKYDAVVSQRYTQNGEEKKRYINVGAVFEGERGLSLKLDAIPVGFDGWIQFYEPRERDAAPAQRQMESYPSTPRSAPAEPRPPAPAAAEPFDDDIPF